MIGVYLVLGALAGVMSGLFGIGGGVIVVPSLASIFAKHVNLPADSVMQFAVGTSLATMIIAAGMAAISHHRHKSVVWPMVFKMAPLLAGGAIIGAIVARFLPSSFLKVFFSIFLFYIGLRMFLKKSKEKNLQPLSQMVFYAVTGLIGFLSSILGVGGGTLLVPFLLRCNLEMHQATGTSVACGAAVAVVSTLCFMAIGLFSHIHIAGATGYIYWPAFLGIALASLLFAPVGAMLSHKLPAEMLKRVFAVFLLLMAVDLLL